MLAELSRRWNLDLLNLVLGCSTPKPTPAAITVASPDPVALAYGTAHSKIMTGFGTAPKHISSRPIPVPPKNATKRERREVYAKELDQITLAAQSSLTRLDALKPPTSTSMREIHQATRDLLLTYRDGNAAYVTAIRRGDRKETDRLGTKSEADTKAAFARLRAVLREGLIREGKTP